MESHQADNEIARAGPAEAYEALLQVERMHQAALRRGLPPRRLGVTIAIFTGALCGAQAADASPAVTALLVVLVAIVLGVERRTLMALARRSSYGFNLPILAGQIVGVVLIMAICIGGRVGFRTYGLTWAPLVAGAGVAATIYLLFEFKMAQFRASIESEERV